MWATWRLFETLRYLYYKVIHWASSWSGRCLCLSLISLWPVKIYCSSVFWYFCWLRKDSDGICRVDLQGSENQQFPAGIYYWSRHVNVKYFWGRYWCNGCSEIPDPRIRIQMTVSGWGFHNSFGGVKLLGALSQGGHSFLKKNPSTFQYILLWQKTDYQYISVHFKQ